jgi:tryptophan 2,3-dioxygenase
MEGYLEGLVYNQYLDYWDYINLDSLLNLQHPRTMIPDEMIFICYHQVTELYFKLTLWEISQILDKENIDPVFFTERLKRMVNYFTNLTHSFAIMVDGMEPEQFLKFRLSLLPASGFQSVQYRMIEIASTELINLVEHPYRDQVRESNIEEQYAYIYWKKGATDLSTGHKTLTLRRFEEKYHIPLIQWAEKHKGNNIHTKYASLPESVRNEPALLEAMREYDSLVNVKWPNVHLKSAGRYLAKAGNDAVPATGGTNWQKYLPPRIQRRIFFNELWNEEELSSWGKI